jgi:hypothetical protein
MHKFWRDVDHKLRVLQHADITDFILILGETDLGLFRYPFTILPNSRKLSTDLKRFGFRISLVSICPSSGFLRPLAA